jgi:hypothetical protein
MKRIVFLLAIVALLAACQESLEDRCAREAKEYTEKKCPTLVIKDVTLDSLRFEKASHTLQYCYTLGGVLDDSAALRQHDLRGSLLKELKNSTAMQQYKDAGYTFRYTYYSHNQPGMLLYDAIYREKDYK